MTRRSSRPDMLGAALELAHEGFRVVPLHTPDRDGRCSCATSDCKSPGKHPRCRHGYKDATRDEALIEDWWTQWPDANIGIATGDGLVGIDVDPRNGGEEALDELERRLGRIPRTRTTRTGGQGWHFYLLGPRNLSSSSEVLGLAGVEIKARGMGLVAPPSLHASGDRYRWDDDGKLADLPGSWLAAIDPPREQPPHRRTTGNSGEVRIPEGRRNMALTEYAGRLRARGKTEEEIRDALHLRNEARCEPPLAAAEVDSIAKSIARYAVGGGTSLGLTDAGNASRFAQAFSADLLYAAGVGWHSWDGTRWAPDNLGTVQEYAKRIADMVRTEADELEGKLRQAALAWAFKSESRSRIEAVISLAKTDPVLAVEASWLDADPHLLNVKNGTVDLRTGQLVRHDPDDLITKRAAVTFDGKARCRRFERFLQEITQGDEQIASFIQRAVGCALWGAVLDHVLFILIGSGANGKSTLLNLLQRVLGDYGGQAEPRLLLQRRNEVHPTGIADLMGRRLVVCNEVPRDSKLDEALVKQLTGGDPIKARKMRQDFFQFNPHHTILLATNYKPSIEGTDDGIWRRVYLIPFNAQFAVDAQDPDLLNKLLEERAGIFNWMVDGCLAWQREGLAPPDAVRVATSDYRAESDAIGRFFDDCCRFDPHGHVAADRLRNAYEAWCHVEGVAAESQQAVGARLRLRGCERSRSTGGRNRWKGVALSDE